MSVLCADWLIVSIQSVRISYKYCYPKVPSLETIAPFKKLIQDKIT